MLVHRTIALALAVTFAVVGIVFLLAPTVALGPIDRFAVSSGWGLPATGIDGGLFRGLAVAYMYVVALLAWMMFRQPAVPLWPTLLAHAKLASAAVSFILLAVQAPYLVYAANGIVDGLVGVGALLLGRRAAALRRAIREAAYERAALRP
jgi:hypothetical protein